MNPVRVLPVALFFLLSTISASTAQSIARIWNEQILAGIRLDTPHPPVHARNLFYLSVVMYDAWAAYDPVAVGYIYHGKTTAGDISAARREAISYAAYRMLRERYALSRSATNTLPALDAQMVALGYDTNNASTDPSTPAGLGNLIAATVSAYAINDGARQLQSYQDLPSGQGGYVPFNPPLVTGTNGTLLIDVNRWQPLAITNALDQSGWPAGAVQTFLGPRWLWVRPFALAREVDGVPWVDPGPQPKLGGEGDAAFRADVIDLITRSSHLTPDDTNLMNLSPGAFGNNSLGANDGTGHPINPATGLPYAPNFVKRGDFGRVIAEYWADGPHSETPPGHWNVIANKIADNPMLEKRIGGAGPVVDDLEWDVKTYFVVNAAAHDAACAAWSVKRYYDGGRPIAYIRYMAQLGQSSITNPPPNHPQYHPNGLPLISNLIEAVTPFTAQQPNGRHAGLPAGAVAIRAWPREPEDPTNQYAGVKWIRGDIWMPYQRATFVSPAFPGYVSGHSTFSRAAAEVLTAITGSPFFPGGMLTLVAESNAFLRTELGPSQTVNLQWGTFYDAADQAGLSRLYGGIHPSADDLPGRRIGSQCGLAVWALARQYFDGSILSSSPSLAIRELAPGQCEVRYDTFRGFYYKLQSTTNLLEAFVDDAGGVVLATNTWAAKVDAVSTPNKYFRVLRSLSP